nr:MAG TPA: hypothetical protein [Caudoviricetes sp.]
MGEEGEIIYQPLCIENRKKYTIKNRVKFFPLFPHA